MGNPQRDEEIAFSLFLFCMAAAAVGLLIDLLHGGLR